MATLKGTWQFNEVLTDPKFTADITLPFSIVPFLTTVDEEMATSINEMLAGSGYEVGQVEPGVYTCGGSANGFFLYSDDEYYIFEFVGWEPYIEPSTPATQIVAPTLFSTNELFHSGIEQKSKLPEWARTITIDEETKVDYEFYKWFTANAKQVTTTISYNGTAIASLFNGQTATLKCKDLSMLDNVVVESSESIGGNGSGANIVPLDVYENGTFYDDGPVIVTETFDGSGEPDVVFDYNGTSLRYFKAKTLVPSDNLRGAIAAGHISITAGGEIIPVTTDTCYVQRGRDYAEFYFSSIPAIIWLTTPCEEYSEENGFEANSVYIVDIWSLGFLAAGELILVTALGAPEDPIEGYFPVNIALSIQDELNVTPSTGVEIINGDNEGVYYRRVKVEAIPTTILTITPSMDSQTFYYNKDQYGNYLDPDKEAFFSQVDVEPANISTMNVLCDIELEGAFKIEYELGDSLSVKDGVIKKHYTDGSYQQVNLMTKYVTGFKAAMENGPGKYTLIVTYTENGITCRTSYDITILGEGVARLQEKTVTENGEVTPDEGYDALSKVVVNVPNSEPVLQEKTATANGTVEPDEGYEGLSKVIVEVPVPDGYIKPSGSKTITTNGSHDVTECASVDVDIQPNLAALTATISSCGTHTINTPDGYDGISSVELTVNVPTYVTISNTSELSSIAAYDGLIAVLGG